MTRYYIQQQSLESEQEYIGHGINPNWYEFVSVEKTDTFDDLVKDSYGAIALEVSPNSIRNERAVYSLLDSLGDIGGLFSILIYMGRIVVSFLTNLSGSKISTYLVTRVYSGQNHETTKLNQVNFEATSENKQQSVASVVYKDEKSRFCLRNKGRSFLRIAE